MRLYIKLVAITLAGILLNSCGGSSGTASGSGGSGIGGTGIAFVKGNVSKVDGQAIAFNQSANDNNALVEIVEIVIPVTIAQSLDPTSLTVSGGSKSAKLNQSGQFELPDVPPNVNFVLVFTFSDGQKISLPIGPVLQSTTVTVVDIELNTNSGTASSGEINVEKNEDDDSEDDDSEDDDSEDDISEDENSEDENSEDSSDSGE